MFVDLWHLSPAWAPQVVAKWSSQYCGLDKRLNYVFLPTFYNCVHTSKDIISTWITGIFCWDTEIPRGQVKKKSLGSTRCLKVDNMVGRGPRTPGHVAISAGLRGDVIWGESVFNNRIQLPLRSSHLWPTWYHSGRCEHSSSKRNKSVCPYWLVQGLYSISWCARATCVSYRITEHGFTQWQTSLWHDTVWLRSSAAISILFKSWILSTGFSNRVRVIVGSPIHVLTDILLGGVKEAQVLLLNVKVHRGRADLNTTPAPVDFGM